MNLESLIHAQLDGEITPAQHAELEARLRADWQARRLYLELADQHARLLHQPAISTGRLHDDPAEIGSFAKTSSIDKRMLANAPTTPPTPWLRRLRSPLALAAIIAFTAAATLFFSPPTATPESTANGVAMLSQLLDAEFERAPMQRGDALLPGHLTLTRGLAQLDFFSGASLLVEGPCALEILSAWEARCLSGRVRIHVPPAAKGFLLHAPDMKLEDLGTEFALNVQGGTSAVHVFEGEVIAHTDQPPASLKEGMSLGSTSQDFLPVSELQSLVRQRQQSRLHAWQQWSQETRRDPRLIAYYTFMHEAEDRWERLVPNVAEPDRPAHAGGIVGARWTEGRWPGKDALEFKRPGDRVRLNLDGTYTALTLACWVKVDSVDKKYSGLLLTDGYDNGEPHWQIYEDGSLMFSLIYRPSAPTQPSEPRGKWNQMYFSPPVFKSDNLGRWHHIAVTYDNQSGEVIQYFDGTEVSREVHPLHQPSRPLTFGPCEIGNWGLPTENHAFPIRHLNGAIDEFALYSTALSATELRELFTQGKPE
jgi:ferric-dicitrate binding protein FerR (iron transport regulator)